MHIEWDGHYGGCTDNCVIECLGVATTSPFELSRCPNCLTVFPQV